MSEPMISLGALKDLSFRLEGNVLPSSQWPTLLTGLDWAAERGFLTTPASDCPALFIPPPSIVEVARAMAAVETPCENPAGPQALSGKPDAKAAGDLNAVADRPEIEAKAPQGAEAVIPAADAAPVPPVAGGGTSSHPTSTPVAGGVAPEPPKRGLPPLWTEEEDARAIAMRVAGHPVLAIAEALGRPEQGTGYRLRHVLKARIAEAMAKGVAAPDEQAASSEQGPAEDPGAAAGNVTEIAAAAPPFDPTRPAWWKEAHRNLNFLGHRQPFTAELDLQLVTGLLKGETIDVLAVDMAIDGVSLKNRWQALVACVGTPEQQRPTLDEQKRLLAILTARGDRAEAAE